MANSSTILVSKCLECKTEFQSYEIEKQFCSPSCKAIYKHRNHENFLIDRKDRNSDKSSKLCRKGISCYNCNHFKKNCSGKETKKLSDSEHLTPIIRNW